MMLPEENATSYWEFKCTAVRFTCTHRHWDPETVPLTILNITARVIITRMFFHKTSQKKKIKKKCKNILEFIFSALLNHSVCFSSAHRQCTG